MDTQYKANRAGIPAKGSQSVDVFEDWMVFTEQPIDLGDTG